MRLFTLVLSAFLTLSSASCGLSYQQRQDKFREHYMTGCQVLYQAPAGQSPSISDPAYDAQVPKVIEGSYSDLERCYLEALAVWSQLEGRVVLNVTIKPNGVVSDTAVAMHNSTAFDAAVGCCFARVVQSARFPEPKDGKSLAIEYPFELRTDLLKIRFSNSATPASAWSSRFPGTVVLAPPQPASGTELHHAW